MKRLTIFVLLLVAPFCGCSAIPVVSSLPGMVADVFDPGHKVVARDEQDPSLGGDKDEPPGLIKPDDFPLESQTVTPEAQPSSRLDPPSGNVVKVASKAADPPPTDSASRRRAEEFYRHQELAMSSGITITPHQTAEGLPSDGTIPIKLATISAVSDVKAHQVGDIVTVNISEAINGQAQANTNLSNARTTKSGLPGFFGATAALASHNPFLDTQNLVNATYNQSTQGGGAMTASDTFTANVSAVVVALTPSGNLYIKGDRRVLIHGEYDVIHLSGIVRPQDLDSNNTVPSNLVANLHLTFSGKGHVHDQQRAGAGSRLLDWLWPF